jgi:glutaredoxin
VLAAFLIHRALDDGAPAEAVGAATDAATATASSAAPSASHPGISTLPRIDARAVPGDTSEAPDAPTADGEGDKVDSDPNAAWPTEGIFGAAARGNLDEVAAALATGAPLDARDDGGMTALAWAIAAGHGEVALALLQRGAEPDVAARDGTTSLMFAAEAGLDAVVSRLIDAGAHVVRADRLGRDALMRAAAANQAKTLTELLERGADSGVRDHQGRSALHHAAEGGAVGTLGKLLEKGSAIDAPDAKGATALHVAAGAGRAEAVGALLDRGAKLNARTSDGLSALDFVVMPRDPLPESLRQGRLLVLDLLVRRGIDRRLGLDPATTPILFRPVLDGLLVGEGRSPLPAFGAIAAPQRRDAPIAVSLPLLDAAPAQDSRALPPWPLAGAMASWRGWRIVPNAVRRAKVYGVLLTGGQTATLSGDALGRDPWEVDDLLLVEAINGTHRLDSAYAGTAYELSIDGRAARRLGRSAGRFAAGSIDVTAVLRHRPERTEFTILDCGGRARASSLFLRVEGPDPERALLHAKVDPPPRMRAPRQVVVAGPTTSVTQTVALGPDTVATTDGASDSRAADLARARARVPITVYRTSWCGPCQRAAEYLGESGLRYLERDVERDPAARAAARALNPRGSVPTIDVGGQVLVGWSADRFEALLDQVAAKRSR